MIYIALAQATHLDRFVDYGALGLFLLITLYAIKALWGRDDRRNEQRDNQLEAALKLYQEALTKLDALQDIRVKEAREYAASAMGASQENLRVVHQNETTASQVAEWMERLESRFEKYHQDMMALVSALHSQGGRPQQKNPVGE